MMTTQHASPQHTPPGDGITMAGSFNVLHLLAHAHSLSFTVFLRTDFGSEGIGMCGIATIMMMLSWGAFANCVPMFVFFLLWLVALIFQRIRSFSNWRRGIAIHSRYNGTPWISRRLFPRVSELNARGVDAFICFAVGGVIAQFNQPLGLYIMAGFFSVMFTEAIMVEANRRRLRQMRDAEIEQRYFAETYKSGRF